MKVILTKNVKKLGNAGQIVDVSVGFARNNLVPQGLAEYATAEAQLKAKQASNAAAKDSEAFATWAKETVESLKGKTLLFKETVSEKGHLFGSITEKEIINRVKSDFNIELEASQIQGVNHIKDLGDHRVEIVFSQDFSTAISVRVEAA